MQFCQVRIMQLPQLHISIIGFAFIQKNKQKNQRKSLVYFDYITINIRFAKLFNFSYLIKGKQPH